MIGKNVLTYNYNDLARGLSTSDDLPDGGFSPFTHGANLTKGPGLLYPPMQPVDASTNLGTLHEIIASCEDPSTNLYNRVFLASDRATNLGTFYTLSGSNVLTARVSTTARTFYKGTSDFLPWYDTANGLNYYATTANDGTGAGNIVKWNGATTKDETWWSVTLGQGTLPDTPWRPMLVYEKELFLGNGNKLHRISTGLVVSNAILELAVGDKITALGIDKGTGYMLIATTTGNNASATRNTTSKILLYDGYSNKVTRLAPIEGVVTAFKTLDDATYVFYNNKIGVFTGSGVRFLRKMSFNIGNSIDLINPHMVTAIDNTMYISEGLKVLAYGELRGNSPKVFHYVWKNTLNGFTQNYSISNVGEGKIALAFMNTALTATKLYTLDLVNTTNTTGGGFYFNWKDMERPIFLREVFVDFFETVPNGTTIGSIVIPNEFGEDNTITITNNTGATKKSFKFVVNSSIKYRAIRPILGWDSSETATYGIKKIVLTYDVAE